MADIELVIKMPESIWVAIQNGEYCGILDDRTYNAIKNGTPLDDVKEQIKQLRSHSARFRTSDSGVAYADSQDILDILDRIGKAERGE